MPAIDWPRNWAISDLGSFPGWLGEDEAFTYLATAGIGLEPSMEEIVSPVKGMEYMAFGLPSCSFDLTETRRWPAGAPAYEAWDVPAFAAAIDELLGDPVRRASPGMWARG